MAVGDGRGVLVFKEMGLVSQVFDEATLATLMSAGPSSSPARPCASSASGSSSTRSGRRSGGRRLVVVDDSIVRGNTTKAIVTMLREAGARQVHVRITSPPVRWPCFYGIDMPTRAELVASDLTADQVAGYLGADSLGYLSLEALTQTAAGDPAASGGRPGTPPGPSARPA
jgi:glutamine phosphoribosylpyrophosphate amidotransferase